MTDARKPFRIVCFAPEGLPKVAMKNFKWIARSFETQEAAEAEADAMRQAHARHGMPVQIAVTPPYPDWWR